MGQGTITDVATGKVTKFYDAATPLSPQQQLLNTETERLKKFYGEQYKVEIGKFASQPMSDEEFKDIAGKLQSKYKLAFNEAKFQMESRQQPKEQTALKQFSEMDAYKSDLTNILKNFRVLPGGEQPSWLRASRQPPSTGMKIANILPPVAAYNIGRSLWPKEKISPDQVEVFDQTAARYDDKSKTWKEGEWRSAKSEEIPLFENARTEHERASTIQNALIGKPTSSLMKTAVTSKRMGGSVAEQTKNYLQQKETGVQRQEPEQIVERGGKKWRIVGHDTDGTPLVEEVR